MGQQENSVVLDASSQRQLYYNGSTFAVMQTGEDIPDPAEHDLDEHESETNHRISILKKYN